MVCQSSLALGLLLLISCFSWSYARIYIKGWETGVNYTTWASDKSFQVGDVLILGYDSRTHTVDEVSASDYSSCSSSNALSTDSSGQKTITFTTAGTHYFICSVPGHCSGGMKLAVTVAASPSTTIISTAPGIDNSGSMSIGPVREMALIGLGGLVGFVLGVL